MQADTHSLLGERGTTALIAVASQVSGLSAKAKNVVAALQAWDFECPTGLDGTDPQQAAAVTDAKVLASAVGCAAFHVMWAELFERTFRDESDAAKLPGHSNVTLLLRALVEEDPFGGRDYWNDVSTETVIETKEQIVSAALEAAATFLVEQLGADPAGWLWGRIHTLSLAADLFAGAGLAVFDSPAKANDGGWYTVDVAPPAGRGDYAQRVGASGRLVCEASEKTQVRCTMELPGGQVHHADDQHYLSLFEDYLVNKPRPLPFSRDEGRMSATRSVQLVPE